MNVWMVRTARSIALVGLVLAHGAPSAASAQATAEPAEPTFAENLQKGVDEFFGEWIVGPMASVLCFDIVLWDTPPAHDDAVTAPVHGFASATDYYSRSSSLGFLAHVRVPTLLLSAENDPVLPPPVLQRVREVAASNARLSLEFVAGGGHVGFVGGPVPWRARYYAEERLFRFFDAAMERVTESGYD